VGGHYRHLHSDRRFLAFGKNPDRQAKKNLARQGKEARTLRRPARAERDVSVTEWQPIPQSAVLRAWAIAETTSNKTPLGDAVREGRCAPELRDKLLGKRDGELTEAEWEALERAILQTRGALLGSLIDLRPQWYEGEVGIEALAQLRFFNLPDWVAKAASRSFGDLAGTRSQPGRQPEFRGFATRSERPIAVGASLEGPLCLIEGYTRCACLLRDYRAGLSTTSHLPLIVGVTPRIREWSNGQGHSWW